MAIQRIVGTAGILKRRRLRKFVKKQKEVMYMLEISIDEKWGPFNSLFDIEVSGHADMVNYWCKVTKQYLDRL